MKHLISGFTASGRGAETALSCRRRPIIGIMAMMEGLRDLKENVPNLILVQRLVGSLRFADECAEIT
jgi:hypothetical protein